MRKLLSFFFALAVTVGVSVSAPAKAGCIIGEEIICGSSAPTYQGPGDITNTYLRYSQRHELLVFRRDCSIF
jgi:hypothetical protein